eukprot:1668187-Pyramimonas_sp.AAC.1
MKCRTCNITGALGSNVRVGMICTYTVAIDQCMCDLAPIGTFTLEGGNSRDARKYGGHSFFHMPCSTSQ